MLKIAEIEKAWNRLRKIVVETPLERNEVLSQRYECNIWLKREDLQAVRSYKIRGAFNKISGLSAEQRKKGVVCASAGNHAQGVAYSCRHLGIKGTIFMPETTPRQKITQVNFFGQNMVEVITIGDTFDDAQAAAMEYCQQHELVFVHPFDDETVIQGQATVALEIWRAKEEDIDIMIMPVGGGGLSAGVSIVWKELSGETKLIGVEPEGAAAMKHCIEIGKVEELETIDSFTDGAAVKKVGQIPFEIIRDNIDQIITVPEGLICDTLLKLYNESAIVAEPAGCLSIAALEQLRDEIKGKNVICVVSGGNNDISRMEEIKERAMLYSGLKHYFIVNFPQRPGALKDFVSDILGPNDSIVHFGYTKKNSRSRGPALVGVVVEKPEDFHSLMERMKEKGFFGEYINDKEELFQFLV